MFIDFAIGLAGLAFLIALIALRIPIAYAMILVGLVGVSLLSGVDIVLSQLKDLAYSQFSIYDLSVVPMFVLMGNIATRAGLSRDLFTAANAWLGRFKGGVAMAAIAACAGFGSVCGSSLATASTMGQVAYPELRRLKYSPALATGTLAAGVAMADDVLASVGIELCSDGVRKQGTRPTPTRSGLLEFPLNVMPDHEHIYHAERTPEYVNWFVKRYSWSDDYGSDSYHVEEWTDRVLEELRDHESRGIPSNMLIHPITLYLADRFRSFGRILDFLASHPTHHLGELLERKSTSLAPSDAREVPHVA